MRHLLLGIGFVALAGCEEEGSVPLEDTSAAEQERLEVGVGAVSIDAVAEVECKYAAFATDAVDGAAEAAAAAFTCPAKTGTCTPGTTACTEDLGCPQPIHACEYTCTAAGTWGPGTECSYNICSANKCG